MVAVISAGTADELFLVNVSLFDSSQVITEQNTHTEHSNER